MEEFINEFGLLSDDEEDSETPELNSEGLSEGDKTLKRFCDYRIRVLSFLNYMQVISSMKKYKLSRENCVYFPSRWK